MTHPFLPELVFIPRCCCSCLAKTVAESGQIRSEINVKGRRIPRHVALPWHYDWRLRAFSSLRCFVRLGLLLWCYRISRIPNEYRWEIPEEHGSCRTRDSGALSWRCVSFCFSPSFVYVILTLGNRAPKRGGVNRFSLGYMGYFLKHFLWCKMRECGRYLLAVSMMVQTCRRCIYAFQWKQGFTTISLYPTVYLESNVVRLRYLRKRFLAKKVADKIWRQTVPVRHHI